MDLIADHIGFAYDRREPILAGFTAAFRSGTLTAIMGPSGRGKSTLLYLLGLLLQPDVGRVLLGTARVDTQSDRDRSALRAREIGFVFQDASLDASRSVLDNVLEPALYAGMLRADAVSRARALLQLLGVEHRESHRPVEISGGQAQRIALCRALVNCPGVVLADEPTGNLDASNGEVVLGALRRASNDGAAVVVVTHDPVTAAVCDETIEL